MSTFLSPKLSPDQPVKETVCLMFFKHAMMQTSTPSFVLKVSTAKIDSTVPDMVQCACASLRAFAAECELICEVSDFTNFGVQQIIMRRPSWNVGFNQSGGIAED